MSAQPISVDDWVRPYRAAVAAERQRVFALDTESGFPPPENPAIRKEWEDVQAIIPVLGDIVEHLGNNKQ